MGANIAEEERRTNDALAAAKRRGVKQAIAAGLNGPWDTNPRGIGPWYATEFLRALCAQLSSYNPIVSAPITPGQKHSPTPHIPRGRTLASASRGMRGMGGKISP